MYENPQFVGWNYLAFRAEYLPFQAICTVEIHPCMSVFKAWLEMPGVKGRKPLDFRVGTT
jgi:hypothetical protein